MSVRARPEVAPVEDTPTQGITLSPAQLTELRRRLERVEQLLKEAVKQ